MGATTSRFSLSFSYRLPLWCNLSGSADLCLPTCNALTLKKSWAQSHSEKGRVWRPQGWGFCFRTLAFSFPRVKIFISQMSVFQMLSKHGLNPPVYKDKIQLKTTPPQVTFPKKSPFILLTGWNCPRTAHGMHPQKQKAQLPSPYSFSYCLLGDCLISGQTVIPRYYGVFRVHKIIVPNVFPTSIYNHFLLLNSRLIWILTTCQFQHASPINISFLGREEAQTMWSCVVL